MHHPAFWQGLSLCASLIVAIGAQNAHVLRMGLRRQHVGLTVASCIAIDVLLISVGVLGMGALIQSLPALLAAVRWLGALFLLWYGLRSLKAAWRGGALDLGDAVQLASRRRALGSVLALSLLNPHVYLDTVVLMGGIGGKLPPAQQTAFSLGASTASALWFLTIGYGARQLAPWFNRPRVWQVIDSLTGCMMLALACLLAWDA